MGVRRFLSILVKEYRHILREPRTLWMVFLSPAFVLLALSALFTSGSGRIDLAVWDHDRTTLSRRFTDVLGSDADFSVTYVMDYAEIDALLVAQRIDAAVVIPAGFADAVQRGGAAPVQVVLDGIDTSLAHQATGSLLAHAADFGFTLNQQLSSISQPLRIASQPAYLTDGDAARNSMIPGLIPIVFSLPAMAAALALARERETGSLESLVATPLRGFEYVMGKLVAYVTASLVGLLPVWLEARFLFDVPFHGSIPLLILLTIAFLMASLAQAVLIGSVVRSQQTATVIALFVFFVPGFFLAGLIDPIDMTDTFSTLLSSMLPITHFVIISRALFIKGAALADMWRPALALVGLSTAWVGLGVLSFKKRMG
ncbi:MAG: ABC transporter permease [Anaerolineae bacterium]|nr:ABC transporter permease [Anaerolineae bacterium]